MSEQQTCKIREDDPEDNQKDGLCGEMELREIRGEFSFSKSLALAVLGLS